MWKYCARKMLNGCCWVIQGKRATTLIRHDHANIFNMKITWKMKNDHSFLLCDDAFFAPMNWRFRMRVGVLCLHAYSIRSLTHLVLSLTLENSNTIHHSMRKVSSLMLLPPFFIFFDLFVFHFRYILLMLLFFSISYCANVSSFTSPWCFDSFVIVTHYF